MKPRLFNTDMVRAILEDRKTVTRLVIKEPWYIEDEDVSRMSGYAMHRGYDYTHGMPYPDSIYHPGDILYVRETWCINNITPHDPEWNYKADYDCLVKPYCNWKWRPSIHMPREAARIFLRVTDVRVERLQSITELDILEKEGVTVDFPQPKPSYASLAYAETRLKPAVRKAFADLWNACYSKPQPVKVKGVITHYESYPWEDIQETRTYRGKPWYVIGNPWVWVIEFERCEKP